MWFPIVWLFWLSSAFVGSVGRLMPPGVWLVPSILWFVSGRLVVPAVRWHGVRPWCEFSREPQALVAKHEAVRLALSRGLIPPCELAGASG